MRFWDSSALLPLVVAEPQTRSVEGWLREDPEVIVSRLTRIEVVRRHAERLIETHPLRAADALQLAAAVVAAEGMPAGLTFVTFDRSLADAAEREGVTVLGLE